MSDMINKEKLNEVLSHEKRVAVNMDKVKEGYDADYFSMESTNADMLFIDQALSTQEDEVLKSEEYRKLKTIQGRNVSHKLLNQQKFLGDSKEMKRVKDSVEALEKLLSEKDVGAARLTEVENAFVNAMKMCDDYIAAKNPWFSKGIERKNKVISQKSQLMEEYDLFMIGKKAYGYKLGSGGTASPLDLITLGRERQDTISTTMNNYRLYFENNLSVGEKVYQDICSKHDEIEKKAAPELSPELSEQLRLEIYYDQDNYNMVEYAQKNYKSEESPHVDRGMMYMQVNYLLDAEDAYKDMHKDEDLYKRFRTLFDAAFNKLNACCRSGDAISFMQGRILSVKMAGKLGDEDNEKLSSVMEYYADVVSAINVMGGRLREIIKKLAAFEILDQDDIEALSTEVSEDIINLYQHRATEYLPKEEKKTSADSGDVTEDRSNALDAFVEKKDKEKADRIKKEREEKEKKEAEDLKKFREHQKEAQNAMKEDMAKIKEQLETRNKEIEAYRSGMSLDKITDEERRENYKTRVGAYQAQFKKEQIQKQIAEERMTQAVKDYDQRMEWYRDALKKQQEYIAWYEKNHEEPAIIRKVQARYDKVKEAHAHEKAGKKAAFWKNIEEDLDTEACYEFSKTLKAWLKEKGYDTDALKDALEGWGNKDIADKVEELLIEYRPKILWKLVFEKKYKEVESVEYEQKKLIPRPNDLRHLADYRLFRMRSIELERPSFKRALEKFSKGEIKQAAMERSAEQLFDTFQNFISNNMAMDVEQKREFANRMYHKRKAFESKYKWTDVADNIKFLQDMDKELGGFIEKEKKLLDELMCYRIMEDDKAMIDERMQDFIFHDFRYLNIDGESLLALKPTIRYTGLKKIEEPQPPKLEDYMPTMQEVEEIMKKEAGIKAHQTHSSADS